MLRPDDCTLDTSVEKSIREMAQRILDLAAAHGRFPTPISDIMSAAKIKVASELWSPELIKRLKQKGGAELCSALSKLLGVYDAQANFVYITPDIHPQKEAFLKLHETAHAFLPWQSQTYSVIEDCEKTLDPAIATQFEREANVFASEVLFQGDRFDIEALDYDFSVQTPIILSKKYGASMYSSIRRYVSTNNRTCAVIVMNPFDNIRNEITVRRIIVSKNFGRYNAPLWPSRITPFSGPGQNIFKGVNIAEKEIISIPDRDGTAHEYSTEFFSNTYQNFLFLKPTSVTTPE